MATDKGMEYATIIYDLETHDILALLDGRDGKNCKEWLSMFPSIRMVCRDRASDLSTAITESLPDAVQVADRFHLVKNLVEYIGEEIKALLPATLYFKDGKLLEASESEHLKKPRKLPPEVMESLSHYDNTPPLDSEGREIVFDSKNRDLESPHYREQAARRLEKQENIRKIKAAFAKATDSGTKPKEARESLATEYGVHPATIKKYLCMNKEEVDAMDMPRNYRKRKTLLDEFINSIYKMLAAEVSPMLIVSYVLTASPQLSPRTVVEYVKRVAKNNFGKILKGSFYGFSLPEGYSQVRRFDILKYMVKNNRQEEAKIKGAYEELLEVYPKLKEYEEVYLGFKEILGSKNPDLLDGFLIDCKGTFLEGFANGIKKDITAVKNAIIYPQSSGFVEGGNNKFKLLKRIGYGRQLLATLFKKCFVAFRIDSEAFNVLSLVSGEVA